MEAVLTETFRIKEEKINWFDKQAANFEESRFGAMAIMLAINTCWGSIAAGLSYGNETIYNLAICSTFSMLNNTILIAQGPAKWCVGIFSIATIVNTAIVLIELLG
ncbi:MAG: hypothetical protein RJQ00_12425 [Vicingaceae bacterium]